MRRISSDQEHEFARQNNLFQRHGRRRQCESYESCTDYCPDHSKIYKHCWSATLNWWTEMAVWSAWQKSGPGRVPLILQYWYRAVTGQKGEETSFASKMSKGLRLTLCLYSVIVIFAPCTWPWRNKNVRLLYWTTERANRVLLDASSPMRKRP